MLLVPVIDLMQARVVHAVRGDRAAYQPVRSALCAGSDPVTVARALCEASAARCLYGADLDALQGGAMQWRVWAAVLQALPTVELWLDAGFAGSAAAAQLQARLPADAARRVVPVFASEALCDATQALAPGHILSLDRRDGVRLDAAGWWDAPQRWPRRVNAMTLARVGAGAGPDLETLAALRRRAPQAQLIGAGGIRDAADLQRAADAGAHAWLVASALHEGRLHDAIPADRS
jgi:phosphoribosylformimino-5-aminoimidazole carboxamide ribotide isomerase